MTTLASLGFDDFFASQLERHGNPQWVPARIVAEGQSSFHLGGCRAPLGDLSGKLLGSLTKIERPVVGDWVAVIDGADRASIQHVFERRTALLRRAAGTAAEPQAIAVNVDVFFVVTAVNREFNERRLERYVTAVWNSGAEPVVVLNKVDLETELDEMLEAIDRAAIGVPVVRASAASGEGVEALRGYIGIGKTVGFIGSSGVGKSSLTNRLLGRDVQAIGGLRNDERGRHTTSSRQLIELPGGGVLGAVASGELPAERLASYRKLLKEIAATERKRDPILAGRTKARWKEVHRALRARQKIDPKLQRDK